MKWTRSDWLNLILLAALVVLFHWQLLTPNPADRQSYPPGDFSAQFWAFSTFEARELSAGRLPLWNPFTYAGSPFWADVQSAVFYPFSLLTLALSGALAGGFSLFALELEAVFHFWLAGSFMYLFARRITQSRPAGLAAALIFAFGGYLTGYPSQQLAVLEVDVWLPLILFFVDRALLTRAPAQSPTANRPADRSNLVAAGAAWGLALLAGHPQSWMLTGYTVTAYFIFLAAGDLRGLSDWPRKLAARLAELAAVLITGVGLAAVQLAPAVEYTLLSVRAQGWYDKMSGGFPLVDLIQLVLPGVVSQYSPLYVGAIGLLLVLAALFCRRDRFTTFWGVWGGLALLISFGGNTFLYSPLYLVAPGFSIFRGQERWAFVAAFSLAALAGYGLAWLEGQGVAQIRAGFGRWLGWALLGAVGLIIAFFYGLNDTGWSADNLFYALLNRSVLLAIILAAAGGIIRVASNGTKSGRLALAAGLSALIVFDLFSANWQTNLYAQPPEWHTQKPAQVAAIEADSAGQEANFRVYNEYRLFDNYGVPFGLQDLWGASPLRLSRYDAFLSPPMLIERAWAMLNVKYVITWRSELYAPSTVIYQEPAADGVTYVHRLNTIGPRAWLVHAVETAPAETMIARLAQPDFDFSRVALLEPDQAELSLAQPAGGATESAAVTAFLPNRVEVQVNAAADALLVLSEMAYPGWRASVDNAPTSLITTDYILRGVPVSAGTHTVVFEFAPFSFTAGAIISALALVFLLAAGVRFRR